MKTASLENLSKFGVQPQFYNFSFEDRASLPKTGGVREFTCKLPKFETSTQEEFELFNVPTRGVLEEVLLLEAEKLCMQSLKPGRTVYEQEGPSPYLAVKKFDPEIE